jgi:hypothetical protein
LKVNIKIRRKPVVVESEGACRQAKVVRNCNLTQMEVGMGKKVGAYIISFLLVVVHMG